MRQVRQHIARRQAELAKHAFVRTLDSTPPLSRGVRFVPLGAFFVLAFQDLVEMIRDRAGDPWLRDLVRRHCEEEVGHDRWFLRDLVRLVGAEPGVAALFGPQHASTRRGTYALAAEAHGARDDVERLCLLLAMESTGEVLFDAVETYFQKVGAADGLVFFAGRHLQAEKDHAVLQEDMARLVATIELGPDALARATALVDRTYAAFEVIVDGLAGAISDAPFLDEHALTPSEAP
jgi:hypothetical protein